MAKYLILPAFLLFSYSIRLLVTGASLGDALVIIGLSSLYFSVYYLKGHLGEPVNKDIINRVVDLEEQIKVSKDKISTIVLNNSFKR